MPHYKVVYFPLRGFAEVIRQILVVSKQEFDDVRILREEWPEHKSKYPFGALPVLEEDGKQLPQSYAIARYLARKYNLAGGNLWEEAQVDSLADQWKDIINEIRPFFAVFGGQAQGDLEKLKTDVFIPALNRNMPFYVNFLKKSGSGYLVGQSLTWIDLMVAEMFALLNTIAPEEIKKFPELKAHHEKVRSNTELKKWIDTRPETQF